VDDFAEELLVGCFEQFFERPNVWRTEAAANAAAEECVNSYTRTAELIYVKVSK